MELEPAWRMERSATGGPHTLAADDNWSKRQGYLIDHAGREQIIVQLRTAFTEQPRQPSASSLRAPSARRMI